MGQLNHKKTKVNKKCSNIYQTKFKKCEDLKKKKSNIKKICQPDSSLFSLKDNQWCNIAATGGPSFIGGHTMISRGCKIYVFGGVNENYNNTDDYTFYNTLWEFDVQKEQWTEIIPSTELIPTARAYHGAFYYKAQDWMFIFGGSSFNSPFSSIQFYNDLWYFNFKTNQWIQVRNNVNIPPTQDPAPTRRDQFGYDIIGNKIYIFGGRVSSITASDQLWEYNILTNEWTLLLSGDPPITPGKRYSLQMFAIKKNRKKNIKNKEKTNKGCCSNSSSDSESDVRREEDNYVLYLYGGIFPELDLSTLNDTWIYSFNPKGWIDITPDSKNNIPQGRAIFHGGVNDKGIVVLPGGDVSTGPIVGNVGCSSPTGRSQNPTNEVWIVKVDTNIYDYVNLDFSNNDYIVATPKDGQNLKYKKVSLCHNIPKVKDHATIIIDNRVYIFGGWDFICNEGIGPGQVWNNQLWYFDLSYH